MAEVNPAVIIKVNFEKEMNQEAVTKDGAYNPIYVRWLEIQFLKTLASLQTLTAAVKNARVPIRGVDKDGNIKPLDCHGVSIDSEKGKIADGNS